MVLVTGRARADARHRQDWQSVAVFLVAARYDCITGVLTLISLITWTAGPQIWPFNGEIFNFLGIKSISWKNIKSCRASLCSWCWSARRRLWGGWCGGFLTELKLITPSPSPPDFTDPQPTLPGCILALSLSHKSFLVSHSDDYSFILLKWTNMWFTEISEITCLPSNLI